MESVSKAGEKIIAGLADALEHTRHREDILALDEAATSTIYGGLFDAFSAENYAALKSAGLIRSYIPAGCMAPITKLTPGGRKAAAALRASLQGNANMFGKTGQNDAASKCATLTKGEGGKPSNTQEIEP